MPKIALLDPKVADQIAAGEVVERPSSVVKELVENSLDAGATRIDVDIEEAGCRLIRVSDNGEGMLAEDLGLAVQRHATSKICSTDDLLALSSYGFRGEALPSIASVSHLSLSSRARGRDEGALLKVDGGQARPLQPTGRADGTTVEVRDLFFNTPARLKFLKAPGTEQGRIVEGLSALALANPSIAFSLSAHGKRLLDYAAMPQPLGRLAQVWGASLAEQALAVDLEESGYRVWGWVVKPQFSRSNRMGQQLFIHRRPVEHKSLGFTLSQAYGSLLPHGRHAVAALFLEVPTADVDVNVHPAKREVRFRQDRAVLDLVRHAVVKALGEAPLEAGLNLSAGHHYAVAAPATPAAWDSARPAVEALLTGFSPAGLAAGAAPALHQGPSPWATRISPAAKPDWPVPLAQLHLTYLLCQDMGGLVLVDQHAAHERVLYERFLKSLERGDFKSQTLLLPQRFQVAPAQETTLQSWLPWLAELGLELSNTGGGLYFVGSVPDFLKQVQVVPLLQDLLAQPPDGGEDPALAFKREAAARLACHAAIKAGDSIRFEEMHQLMADLSACEIPWACPHGRPPLVRLSLAELEKHFQRR